ncbi:MAG: hypothetical protein AAB214_15625 [Fibrobacterota bacterium]
MKRIQILALFLSFTFAGSAYAGADRVGLAIAPGIVKGGDLAQDLVEPMQDVVGEMLSWEASMVPNVKVVDPAMLSAALEKVGWSGRTDLTRTEIEDARTASRQLDADAVVLTRFVHDGRSVQWQVALGYRRETKDLSLQFSGRSGEDEFVQKIRERALTLLDSLGVKVPPSAHQIVKSRGAVTWEALVEYAAGLRDQKSGRNDEALRHLQEASRRAPFLPALQVRLKKLQQETQSTR